MPSSEISHHLDLEPELPDEIIEIGRRQGEDPDKVCAYIQELRDLIYERGDCTPHRTDDKYLLKFLRARFFKVENAYKLLCRYCTFREQNRELYDNVNPLSLKQLGEDDIVSVAPCRDQNGRRMTIFKLKNWKPSKIPIIDIFKLTVILYEMGSLEPQAQILGGIGIFDLEGLTVNHAWHVSPSVAQKIISIMVTCMPLRTDAIHIVNQSWAFDVIFKMFKPFLNDRMRERIFIHGNDMESLHKQIYPEHLPEKYGGKLPEYPYTFWMTNLGNNQHIVNELKQLGYDIDDNPNSIRNNM